jgi:hypothetical protein
MKKCFVISPIGDEGTDIRAHSDDVFEFIIQPAMKELDIHAYRSDHSHTLGKISDQMFESILNDDLCIAVLTYQNPNVYYELAVAQSAARPVVILIEKGGYIPFDLKDLRAVWYDLKPRPLRDRVYVNEIIEKVKSLESCDWKTPVPFGPDLVPLSRHSKDLDVYGKAELFGLSDKWLELMDESSTHLDGCGLSMHSWTRYQATRSILLKKAEEGCKIRLLVIDPDNPALMQFLNEEDRQGSLERVRKDIQDAIAFFGALSSENQNIQIRTIVRGCPHQQLFLNDKRVIITPYLYSRATFQSPLIATDSTSPLHGAYQNEFNVLWDANQGHSPRS